MAKASLDILNTLHDAVAKALMANIDDPKTMANAIKFLKDNDITADLVGSEDMGDLQSAIRDHLETTGKTMVKLSVNDMLELGA